MRRAAACLLALCTVAVAAACGGGGDDGGGSSSEARALLERASTAPITSAQLRGRVAWDIAGFPLFGSGPMELTGAGRVQSNGPRTLPTADAELFFEGGGQSFPIGVTTTPRNAWLELLGRAYAVLPRPRAGVTDAAPAKPTTLRRLGLHPERWFEEGATVSGGPPVGGEPTRRIGGDVDAQAMLADLARLSRLGALVPALADGVESFTATVDVDRRGVARRVTGTIRVDFPRGEGPQGIEAGTIRFVVTVEKVGVPVAVAPPERADSLRGLLRFAERAFGLRLTG